MKFGLAIALVAATGLAPRFSPAPTRVDYTLRVDSADLSAVSVEMHIRGAPDDFHVAMATHAEYDDQYWRYLTDLSGTSTQGAVIATREDSSVWHVAAPAGDVTLWYRVHYPVSPAMQQASWKAHLTSTGGLIGGPHSFLYVIGGEHVPVRLTLTLPHGWKIATGLAPGAANGTYTAPDAIALIDSPMLIGHFRAWQFTIDGVPHQISYLGQPGGVSFDSALFVSNVEKVARETAKMFGSMPYKQYQFLFEDGAFGGLEHRNSVSMGVRSSDVARDPNSPLPQIVHEFFHTWNEVHLRPVAWVGIRRVMPAPTGELWWAEGVTLYYADLLARRAGLHVTDSTRVAHLERLIATYNANPSHGMVSLEQTSRGFNLPTGVNGDYTPSMYTQGEVVGAMLDMIIRSKSRGARSLDDVMRSLVKQFTPQRGYTGADIEHAVSAACGCNAGPFFAKYVRTANAVNFDPMLVTLGWRAKVTWQPARSESNVVLPDTRVQATARAGETEPRLLIWFPSTAWGRAGLHTGDRIVTWNGLPPGDAAHVRSAIGQLRLGDTVRVAVIRESGQFEAVVVVGGYDRPVARIEDLPAITAAQRAIRAGWMAGR